jgi:hypothetical protein
MVVLFSNLVRFHGGSSVFHPPVTLVLMTRCFWGFSPKPGNEPVSKILNIAECHAKLKKGLIFLFLSMHLVLLAQWVREPALSPQ